MSRRFTWLTLVVAPLFFLGADTPKAPKYEPSTRYETRTVDGWTVLVNKGLLKDHPALANRTIEHLRQHLHQIVHKLPEPAVKKLRQVRIWVEEKEPHHPCMAYHPDPNWLRDHDMNPEKARCVEIANARNFLQWTREQPWMVLHELAHAYHHQFLDQGFENAPVRKAYEAAKKDGKYDSVLHWNGDDVTAYAKTNPMEYFAEATESFFGSNDFYPFVEAELRRHDPDMHSLLGQLWNRR